MKVSIEIGSHFIEHALIMHIISDIAIIFLFQVHSNDIELYIDASTK